MYSPQHGRNLQRQAYAQATPSYPGIIQENISSNVYKYPGSTGFQVVTLTIGAIAANTDYVVSVNNITLTSNSAALAVAAFTTQLLNALRAASNIASVYVIESAAAGTITMTHRISGQNETVAISGGAATAAAVDSVANDPLPFGRVLVTDPTVTNTVDQLMPIQLPSAAGGNVVGAGGAFEVAEMQLMTPNGSQGYGVWPDNEITALKLGTMTLEAESDILPETKLFWRHTADGALDKLGAVAAAAGTGLEGGTAIAGVTIKSLRESFRTTDGRIGVECSITIA